MGHRMSRDSTFAPGRAQEQAHRSRASIHGDGGPQARSGNRSWYVHGDSLESIMLYRAVSSRCYCAVSFWLGLLAQLGDVHGLHR